LSLYLLASYFAASFRISLAAECFGSAGAPWKWGDLLFYKPKSVRLMSTAGSVVATHTLAGAITALVVCHLSIIVLMCFIEDTKLLSVFGLNLFVRLVSGEYFASWQSSFSRCYWYSEYHLLNLNSL
jgi:hypothetical protein